MINRIEKITKELGGHHKVDKFMQPCLKSSKQTLEHAIVLSDKLSSSYLRM